MSHGTLSKLILERLLTKYGSLLTNAELAAELRVEPQVLYNRRSRNRTGGMPAALPGVLPLQFRATDIALWLAGESSASAPPPDRSNVRRGPGRPRKLPSDGVRRELGRG